MNIDNMIASQRSSSGDMLPSVFRKQCKPNHGVTRIHKEDKCSIKIQDTKALMSKTRCRYHRRKILDIARLEEEIEHLRKITRKEEDVTLPIGELQKLLSRRNSKVQELQNELELRKERMQQALVYLMELESVVASLEKKTLRKSIFEEKIPQLIDPAKFPSKCFGDERFENSEISDIHVEVMQAKDRKLADLEKRLSISYKDLSTLMQMQSF